MRERARDKGRLEEWFEDVSLYFTIFMSERRGIIERLFCFIGAVAWGWLPVLFVLYWFPDPFEFNFSVIIACVFMALVSAVSLYFLYNALFLNTINHRRELKERQRKRARLAQLGSIREECFQHSIDTDTLILLDNVTDYDQLEKCVFDNMDDDDKESLVNLPLLKKRGEGSYVITFPHGVTRQALCDLVDDIWCFCSCAIQAWCRPELFKKHTGEWLYLCYGKEDILIALDENGTQWNIDPDDAMLCHSQKHYCIYKARPEIY